MSDISTITTSVRYLVEDFSLTQNPGDIFTYTTSAIFTLTEINPIAVTAVLVNDVNLGDSEYSFDSTTNKVTVSASLTSGDTVEIRYTYYPNYSDSVLEGWIRAAVIFLSVNQYYTFEVDSSDNFYPDVSDSQRNLVAFVASILIKPDNTNYRLPDISFAVPKTLSTRDLVSKAVAIFKHDTHGNFQLS